MTDPTPAREPVTLDEQIAVVQERVDVLDAAASMVHRGLRHAFEEDSGSAAWRAIIATLQQHKRAMAVVEAARRVAKVGGYFRDRAELSITAIPAWEDMADALAAFDTADPSEPKS